jgi:hypothetical protein
VNATSPAWVLCWELTAIAVAAAAGYGLTKLRDRRHTRERDRRDAMFCAAHDIDWTRTAGERTP